LAPGTLNIILKQADLEVESLRYAVVIELAEHNYSAYVPDLPGCVATGGTIGLSHPEGEASNVNTGFSADNWLKSF